MQRVNNPRSHSSPVVSTLPQGSNSQDPVGQALKSLQEAVRDPKAEGTPTGARQAVENFHRALVGLSGHAEGSIKQLVGYRDLRKFLQKASEGSDPYLKGKLPALQEALTQRDLNRIEFLKSKMSQGTLGGWELRNAHTEMREMMTFGPTLTSKTHAQRFKEMLPAVPAPTEPSPAVELAALPAPTAPEQPRPALSRPAPPTREHSQPGTGVSLRPTRGRSVSSPQPRTPSPPRQNPLTAPVAATTPATPARPGLNLSADQLSSAHRLLAELPRDNDVPMGEKAWNAAHALNPKFESEEQVRQFVVKAFADGLDGRYSMENHQMLGELESVLDDRAYAKFER